jgi:hypothetical protein
VREAIAQLRRNARVGHAAPRIRRR